jgi:hypothetical protein
MQSDFEGLRSIRRRDRKVAWFSHDQIPEALKPYENIKLLFEQEKTYIRKVFFFSVLLPKGTNQSDC